MSASGMPWHQVLRHSPVLVAGSATSVVAAGVVAAVVVGGPRQALPPGTGGSTHGASVGTVRPSSPGRKTGSDSGPVPSTSGRSVPVPSLAGSTGPGPSAVPGPSGSTVPAASSGTPTSAATSPASSPAATVVIQGTLSVSPGTLDLVAVNATATGTLTLTAEGGPIGHYSVTVASAVAGEITVSPSSGSLAAGASETVTVTSDSLLAVDAQILVEPGSHTVTVLLSL
jgi:hypothetical protein